MPGPCSLRSTQCLPRMPAATERRRAVAAQIAADKRQYRDEWLAHDPKGRVNPQRFFDALRAWLPDDGIVVADDGNHTFLVAELMPIRAPRTFFSPSDFNSMGYCIPAVIGAKLARPDRTVVGIVGDGAVRMTGLEMATAVAQKTGVAWFVFNDGELAQIAQAQETPYNRKTCTVLPELDFEGLARANRVAYRAMRNDGDIDRVMQEALASAAAGEPVLVDVAHRLFEAHAIHRRRDPHQPETIRARRSGAPGRPCALAAHDRLISRRPASQSTPRSLSETQRRAQPPPATADR